ncbi:ferredoxin--NADP reductase [Nocardia sp. 348MFTsu5.1]|uniref:ferredoxin--NADP reductase n=1 Tax=Nocardia sp. 348MFTsu5.1 TaxID=1172185 RepID=UPI0003A0946D|nr:ferredoxin--NADP reductase [Nocardia sp. 348MFTsu5.1]
MRVIDVVEETHDARSILVEPHPDHADAFDYTAGQFLTVRIPDSGRGSARCYSLSSSPHVDATMKFTVKRVVGGHGSNWLCEQVGIGDELEVLPPAGTFKVRELSQSVVMIAGGSGITPVIAIAKSILFGGDGNVLLIYANRDEGSVIFAEELRALSEQFATRLTVVHVLESVQGYLTAPALSALVRPFAERAVYVCGPVPLMALTKDVCSALGIESSRVMAERFVSLSTDPFKQAQEIPKDVQDSDPALGTECTVNVAIDGDRRTISWPRNKRLLDALLDADVDAPFSCREGACSACVCRLTDGEVRLARNEVLESADLQDGYILACQAEPVTGTISIEY